MTYIKVFVDWRSAIEPLSDAARGRLFTALLDYAETGEVPKMPGNERFLFPMMRSQLDRDAASYEEVSRVRSEQGRKGGLAKAGNCQQMPALLSKPGQDKDKDKDKDKEKDKDSSRGAVAPGERRAWKKRPPGPSAPAPETVAADRKRMERFLQELRREAAELDDRKAALPPDAAGS